MTSYISTTLLFTFLMIFTSCSSYRKIPYFQDLNMSKVLEEPLDNYTPPLVQPQDILGISVSSLNPEASAVFNYNLNRVNGNNYDLSPGNPVVGYLVDDQGEINVPIVGAIKVSGLTTSEISHQLQTKLLPYLKEPIVNLRIINFKVAVFGDVLKPDMYMVQNERITIPEALSLAGDLNITAIRTNVLLVREQNGKRQYIPIDLTSKGIFKSPYFYLKNNDVIYVQADKTKFATVDRGYRTASLVLSGLSVLAITLSTILLRR
ncbi:polysaccharide biosynthesis/export family protein [Hymenobacter sp. P5252]|uniref:Polysaccharide biosynthesis/export family protein n=2 Tax=Hymenobacter terrestris TaxID=2748310 RepID=A0ABX2Q567_9BACT|nr:polysaccharide biosynthesis/export family protein [Hymenobacter terrestris]